MSDDEEEIVMAGIARYPYRYLKCPILGVPRNSMLCETICADHAWSTKKRNEVRSECESYEKFLEMREELLDGNDTDQED